MQDDLRQPDADSAAFRHRLLAQMLEDEAGNGFRSQSEYQSMFPGNDEVVAEVLAEVSDTHSAEFEGKQKIGPYLLLEELGRGGQGTVFLARDPRLTRVVALKVLSRHALTPERIARFRREAHAASRLDHPGICAVYETGEADGVLFLAMRHVRGETLAMHIARAAAGKPSPEHAQSLTTALGHRNRGDVHTILHTIEQVARALHIAHEADILHRDVKPQNIMIGSDGQPVLLDFGLARDLEDDAPALTQTNDIFGTPGYMPLEQLRPSRHGVDRRADIYSLGVTLFECLTLRRPHQERNPIELAERLQSEPTPDLRDARGGISTDLAVVVRCAMAVQRDDRYATALAFAEDLRAIRAREPIQAKPANIGVRLVRWVQRNPVIFASQVLVFLSLATGLLFSQLAYADADRERERADGGNYASQMLAASSQLADDPYAAERRLDATDAARRGFEWRLLKAMLEDGDRLFELPADDARACAYAADGTRLFATAHGRDVRVLRLGTGEVVQQHTAPSGVVQLTFSDDASLLAISSDRQGNRARHLTVLDVGDGSIRFDDGGKQMNASDVSFSSDGRYLLSRVKPWSRIDLQTRSWQRLPLRSSGRARVSPEAHTFTIRGHQFSLADGSRIQPHKQETFTMTSARSPDGRWVAGIHEYVRASFVAPADAPDEQRELVRLRAIPNFVKWNRDGSLLVTGSFAAGRIVVQEAETWRTTRDLRVPWTRGTMPSLNPAGTSILACTKRGVEEFDIQKSGSVLGPHDDYVTGVAFSPDGGLLASSTTTGSIWLWDPDSGEPLGNPRQHAARQQMEGVAFGADGLSTYSMTRWGSLWRLPLTGAAIPSQEQRRVSMKTPIPWSELAPGSRITRGWTQSSQRAWRTDPVDTHRGLWSRLPTKLSAARPREAETWIERMHSEAWALAAKDSVPRSADAQDIAARLRSQAKNNVAVAFSHDERWLAYGHHSGSVLIFDLRDGKLERSIDAHIGAALAVAFTPDGRLLTGGLDTVLNVWNPVTGEHLLTFSDHKGAIECIAVSPDGTRFATASADRTVRLWDTRSVWQRRHDAQEQRVHDADLRTELDARLATDSRQDVLREIWTDDSLPLAKRRAARRLLLDR